MKGLGCGLVGGAAIAVTGTVCDLAVGLLAQKG